MSNKDELYKFFNAVDNLLNSKLVFAGSYISDLLHSIADSEDVYNLIAKCMVNFDFIEEWQTATTSNYIEFPQDSSKQIAFIFCMLNNIDDNNLDINKVLEHYFTFDENVPAYEIFKQEVVYRFRNLIADELGIDENFFDGQSEAEEIAQLNDLQDTQSQIETEQIDKPKQIKNAQETSDEKIEIKEENRSDEEKSQDTKKREEENKDMKNLLSAVLEMKKQVRSLSKFRRTPISRTDLIAIISTLEYAIKTNESEYFYALVLSIKYLVKSIKSLKIIAERIEQISNKIIRS